MHLESTARWECEFIAVNTCVTCGYSKVQPSHAEMALNGGTNVTGSGSNVTNHTLVQEWLASAPGFCSVKSNLLIHTWQPAGHSSLNATAARNTLCLPCDPCMSAVTVVQAGLHSKPTLITASPQTTAAFGAMHVTSPAVLCHADSSVHTGGVQ
jgi:hypothetical protein